MENSGKIKRTFDETLQVATENIAEQLEILDFAEFLCYLFQSKDLETIIQIVKLAYKRNAKQLISSLDDAITIENNRLIELYLDAIQAQKKFPNILNIMYWDQIEELIKHVQTQA